MAVEVVLLVLRLPQPVPVVPVVVEMVERQVLLVQMEQLILEVVAAGAAETQRQTAAQAAPALLS